MSNRFTAEERGNYGLQAIQQKASGIRGAILAHSASTLAYAIDVMGGGPLLALRTLAGSLRLAVAQNGDISTTGNVTLAQGKGLNVTTGGSAARAGTVILDNSLATVATTAITENSIVIMTYQAEDGAPGTLTVSARTPGVSFEISGDGVANTSTVGWLIIEPV